MKRKNAATVALPSITTNESTITKPTKIDTMSLAGVGNAAAGVLAANLATNLFIREENKPATKKDLQEVKDLLLTRYYPILNLSQHLNGAKPFYDLDTQQVVYLSNRR
ncbi:hypothetical protein [Flavobacterium antarcticum]|uniref:hypothetical protein n=1 Tax=Flavobacterium antarcticum TaxID=271155 RepID=UPI0003B3CCF1|nr:hypothetical protein [Flavobacterium antarcticum]